MQRYFKSLADANLCKVIEEIKLKTAILMRAWQGVLKNAQFRAYRSTKYRVGPLHSLPKTRNEKKPETKLSFFVRPVSE